MMITMTGGEGKKDAIRYDMDMIDRWDCGDTLASIDKRDKQVTKGLVGRFDSEMKLGY